MVKVFNTSIQHKLYVSKYELKIDIDSISHMSAESHIMKEITVKIYKYQ